MPQIHVNCALCDKFLPFGMMLGMGLNKVIKNHRKQSGPVCTTLKMAAIRIRKYHMASYIPVPPGNMGGLYRMGPHCTILHYCSILQDSC